MPDRSAKEAVTKLRRLLPRANKRDREVLLMAIDAITDLAVQLHRATHPLTPENYGLQQKHPDTVLEQTLVDEAL